MTSTNDGKDVKSNQTSGPKGKTYYIELYKFLEARLSEGGDVHSRTKHLCAAWRSVHSLCQQSAPSTHAHLLNWLQRHTARAVLQTEWQTPKRKDDRTSVEEAIDAFIAQVQEARRDGGRLPWEAQLVARGEWFKRVLDKPWDHPVLTLLLNPTGIPPTDDEVLAWLKEERGVTFVVRLHTLVGEKCDDIAAALAGAVMTRARAALPPTLDSNDQTEPTPVKDATPTFADKLKQEAGFSPDLWETLTDIEFVLLHKRDSKRCIALAKQTPLLEAYPLIERLQKRLETAPREKRLWKNAKEVAILIAQVVIARCMVVRSCAGASRTALYCCTRLLARLLVSRLPAAADPLAAQAPTARHLHTLAQAVDKQLSPTHEDMKPYVCELYVRAITAGMNELERLKLKTEKESEARSMEKTLASWFVQLGTVLARSARIACECTLTAFSLHPSQKMYERIDAAPPLAPVIPDNDSKEETVKSEFGSWASDSRSQTNLVKTSETLNLKQTQNQANVLSTAIFNEGEALGLSPELCQDIAVLLSGPRVKTLSWDMDRALLLENCRAYSELTHQGTRVLTRELKYLNIDPQQYQHLPEEKDDDENDPYYGIERGYEHLAVLEEPEEIWDYANDSERTETASSIEEDYLVPRGKKKKKRLPVSTDEEADPLSFMAETKRTQKKKERPHSKERSKSKKKQVLVDPVLVDPVLVDPLDIDGSSQPIDQPQIKKEPKEKKVRKKKEKVPKVIGGKRSSLANLVGVKMNKKKPKAKANVATPVTDSDYDSQAKNSLTSLKSERYDPDAGYHESIPGGQRKSQEHKSNTGMTNSLCRVTYNMMGNKYVPSHILERPSNNLSRMVYRPQTSKPIRQPSPSDINKILNRNLSSHVRQSVSRLLEFRRQRYQDYKSTDNKVPPTPPRKPTIIRPDISLQTNISPKGVAIPEIPKSYINKEQAEKLTETVRSQNKPELKDSVIQFAKKTDVHKTKTASSSSESRHRAQHDSLKMIDIVDPTYDRLMAEIVERQARGTNIKPAHSLYQPQQSYKSLNTMTPGQRDYQNFLKEYEQNKRMASHAIDMSKSAKEVKKPIMPVSRVIPVVPKVSKPESKPVSSKQTVQKKPEISLNTFSRLNYHKNKQNELKKIQSPKPICTTTTYQDVSSELDEIIKEHQRAQLKVIQAKRDHDRSMKTSNVDQSVPQDHPLLCNLLHNSPSRPSSCRPETTFKCNQVQQTSTPKTSLSNKQNNDLLNLLRQQKNINNSHYYSTNVTSKPLTSTASKVPPVPTYNSTSTQTRQQPKQPVKLVTPEAKSYASTLDTKIINAISTSILNPGKHEISKSLSVSVKPQPNSSLSPVNFTQDTVKNIAVNDQIENKYTPKSKPEWMSVMNELLKHKTRRPNTVDVAHGKSSFESAFEKSINEPSILSPSSSETDTVPTKNQENAGRPKPVITSIQNVIITKKGLKIQNEIPKQQTNQSTDPKVLLKHSGATVIEKLKTQNNPYSSKKLPKEAQRKQFTYAGPKYVDPFISGIPNSDYDLLEELMDDDLRKEIGELSSDDESYNAAAQSFLKTGKSHEKRVSVQFNKSHNETATPTSSNVHCSNDRQSTNKTPKPETLKQVSQCTNKFVRTPRECNLSKVQQKSANNTRDNSLLPSTSWSAPTPNSSMIAKNQMNNNVKAFSSQVIIDPNIYLSVPQPAPVQNVVVLEQKIVYGGYTSVQTPVQSMNNQTPNAYVAVNTFPTMTLYQTTQYPAPVVFGSSVTVPVINNVTAISGQPTVISNIAQSFHPAATDKLQTSVVDSSLTTETSDNTETNSLQDPVRLQDWSKKNHKYQEESKTSERKVLSEVHLDTTENKDKNLNQEIETNIDMNKKKQNIERLKNKRLAIINREIYHRCGETTIPLTYTPLPMKPDIEEPDLPKAITISCSSLNCNKEDSQKQQLCNSEEEKLLAQIKKNLQDLSDAINEVPSPATPDSTDSKENKSYSAQCRRILLRSSNKVIPTLTAEKIPDNQNLKKSRAKLKSDVPKAIDKAKTDEPNDKESAAPKRAPRRVRNKKMSTKEEKKSLQKQHQKPCTKIPSTVKAQRFQRGIEIDSLDCIDIESKLEGTKISKLVGESTNKLIANYDGKSAGCLVDTVKLANKEVEHIMDEPTTHQKPSHLGYSSQETDLPVNEEALIQNTTISEEFIVKPTDKTKAITDGESLIKQKSNQTLQKTVTSRDDENKEFTEDNLIQKTRHMNKCLQKTAIILDNTNEAISECSVQKIGLLEQLSRKAIPDDKTDEVLIMQTSVTPQHSDLIKKPSQKTVGSQHISEEIKKNIIDKCVPENGADKKIDEKVNIPVSSTKIETSNTVYNTTNKNTDNNSECYANKDFNANLAQSFSGESSEKLTTTNDKSKLELHAKDAVTFLSEEKQIPYGEMNHSSENRDPSYKTINNQNKNDLMEKENIDLDMTVTCEEAPKLSPSFGNIRTARNKPINATCEEAPKLSPSFGNIRTTRNKPINATKKKDMKMCNDASVKNKKPNGSEVPVAVLPDMKTSKNAETSIETVDFNPTPDSWPINKKPQVRSETAISCLRPKTSTITKSADSKGDNVVIIDDDRIPNPVVSVEHGKVGVASKKCTNTELIIPESQKKIEYSAAVKKSTVKHVKDLDTVSNSSHNITHSETNSAVNPNNDDTRKLSDIPQKFKDNIKIEDIPSTDPTKKKVRISLPNGRKVIATVGNEVCVTLDTLFAYPSIREALFNDTNWNINKRYTLFIKQVTTLDKDNPNKILSAQISELKPPVISTGDNKPLETIDLLSDDEDSGPPQKTDTSRRFVTQYGVFSAPPMDEGLFLKHQAKLIQKSRIFLEKLDAKPDPKIHAKLENHTKKVYGRPDVTKHIAQSGITSSNPNVTYVTSVMNDIKENAITPSIPNQYVTGLINDIENTLASDVNRKTIVNPEVVEIDDSSNDILFQDNSAETKTKDKTISDLKNVLLKELGVEVQTKVSASKSQGDSSTNEIVKIESGKKSNRRKVLKLSSIPAGQTCPFDDLDEEEQLKITKRKCAIKLVRCDDMVIKYEEDHRSAMTRSSAQVFDDESITIIDKINSFGEFNEKILETDERSSSPVLELFDVLATFNYTSKDQCVSAVHNVSLLSCEADWSATKLTIYLQSINDKALALDQSHVSESQKNISNEKVMNNTIPLSCEANWLITKTTLHSQSVNDTASLYASEDDDKICDDNSINKISEKNIFNEKVINGTIPLSCEANWLITKTTLYSQSVNDTASMYASEDEDKICHDNSINKIDALYCKNWLTTKTTLHSQSVNDTPSLYASEDDDKICDDNSINKISEKNIFNEKVINGTIPLSCEANWLITKTTLHSQSVNDTASIYASEDEDKICHDNSINKIDTLYCKSNSLTTESKLHLECVRNLASLQSHDSKDDYEMSDENLINRNIPLSCKSNWLTTKRMLHLQNVNGAKLEQSHVVDNDINIVDNVIDEDISLSYETNWLSTKPMLHTEGVNKIYFIKYNKKYSLTLSSVSKYDDEMCNNTVMPLAKSLLFESDNIFFHNITTDNVISLSCNADWLITKPTLHLQSACDVASQRSFVKDKISDDNDSQTHKIPLSCEAIWLTTKPEIHLQTVNDTLPRSDAIQSDDVIYGDNLVRDVMAPPCKAGWLSTKATLRKEAVSNPLSVRPNISTEADAKRRCRNSASTEFDIAETVLQAPHVSSLGCLVLKKCFHDENVLHQYGLLRKNSIKRKSLSLHTAACKVRKVNDMNKTKFTNHLPVHTINIVSDSQKDLRHTTTMGCNLPNSPKEKNKSATEFNDNHNLNDCVPDKETVSGTSAENDNGNKDTLCLNAKSSVDQKHALAVVSDVTNEKPAEIYASSSGYRSPSPVIDITHLMVFEIDTAKQLDKLRSNDTQPPNIQTSKYVISTDQLTQKKPETDSLKKLPETSFESNNIFANQRANDFNNRTVCSLREAKRLQNTSLESNKKSTFHEFRPGNSNENNDSTNIEDIEVKLAEIVGESLIDSNTTTLHDERANMSDIQKSDIIKIILGDEALVQSDSKKIEMSVRHDGDIDCLDNADIPVDEKSNQSSLDGQSSLLGCVYENDEDNHKVMYVSSEDTLLFSENDAIKELEEEVVDMQSDEVLDDFLFDPSINVNFGESLSKHASDQAKDSLNLQKSLEISKCCITQSTNKENCIASQYEKETKCRSTVDLTENRVAVTGDIPKIEESTTKNIDDVTAESIVYKYLALIRNKSKVFETILEYEDPEAGTCYVIPVIEETFNTVIDPDENTDIEKSVSKSPRIIDSKTSDGNVDSSLQKNTYGSEDKHNSPSYDDIEAKLAEIVGESFDENEITSSREIRLDEKYKTSYTVEVESICTPEEDAENIASQLKRTDDQDNKKIVKPIGVIPSKKKRTKYHDNSTDATGVASSEKLKVKQPPHTHDKHQIEKRSWKTLKRKFAVSGTETSEIKHRKYNRSGLVKTVSESFPKNEKPLRLDEKYNTSCSVEFETVSNPENTDKEVVSLQKQISDQNSKQIMKILKPPSVTEGTSKRRLNCFKEAKDEIENLKVKLPKRTYSQTTGPIKTLRKSMSDTKTSERKYRKGKNIDYPRYTAAALSETGYAKEYKNLIEYCSSVKFSYAVPFHKENINVHDQLKSWPIKYNRPQNIEHSSELNENLFADIDTSETLIDPLEQSLQEEIITKFDENSYTPSNIHETNFNMGFGERSGRVIQEIKDGEYTKFSAATLSDVKHLQPLLPSDYKLKPVSLNCVDTIVHDQKIKAKLFIDHLNLRDKVRSFFEKTKAELDNEWKHSQKKDTFENNSSWPFGHLTSTRSIRPAPVEITVNVVQVGQLPVSAAAQNPVTCDPRVTHVSNASPSQCSPENSLGDELQTPIKTEYTELTTADITLPLMQEYVQHHSIPSESQEPTNLYGGNDSTCVPTQIKSIVKIELMEETSQGNDEDNVDYENNSVQQLPNGNISNNVQYQFENIASNVATESDLIAVKSQKTTAAYTEDRQNTDDKPDQLAHAMNAAGIPATKGLTKSNNSIELDTMQQNTQTNMITSSQANSNNFSKATPINAIALQQALAQILPPPLNQTNTSENNQQTSASPQVLHIVQGNNAQSVINKPNGTQLLHIVQNKSNVNTNGTPATQQNTFSGLSLVDGAIQQGGNQLLHIVNAANQKNSNAGQLLKRVNLLTNLANVQGANEQKMVQFVCKSADGKSIQLPHQRSMVLRLQPLDPLNVPTTPKQNDNQDHNSTSTTTHSKTDKDINPQEMKSRSLYEENYAKFVQNDAKFIIDSKLSPEKATSLPKFNQVFGKQVYQEKQNEAEPSESQPETSNPPEDNSAPLEQMNDITNPPMLIRKTNLTQPSHAQPNLVQQIKQTIGPMNIQTMHGGVIYTRQIPVNIGNGQTNLINLITVPSTEVVDDSAQKQQADGKFGNTEGDPPIIKIVSSNQPATTSNAPTDDNNTPARSTNETNTPPNLQPQQVLTQMRIKLPMLSKAPQMVGGTRVVRPSFFQIQRNVIGGANQQVYQQLVLTAAPSLGQSIRLPAQVQKPKTPSETQSSPESQMSSSTLEQLREFDMVLEQVKERSTVQPGSSTTSTNNFTKLKSSPDTTDAPNASTSTQETPTQILYSVGNTQPLNIVNYVNRKSTITSTTTSSFVRSPDSTGTVESPSSSTPSHLPHTVSITSDSCASSSCASEAAAVTTVQPKPKKKKPKPSTSNSNPFNIKNTPKPSSQKPLEDEQTTQRILYILAEYKEQVENSPDKDKPAPRRRNNPAAPNAGSSKRKKSSSGSRRRDMSPVLGEDSCRTMGSEDSSCGTSLGECNECSETHSPEESPKKVVRRLTFEQETQVTQTRTTTTTTTVPQRNVIVTDGQAFAVRGAPGKPATTVLMPANYLLPVSMVKGGQQIAIVTNRGPKLLVGAGEGGAGGALLFQRLIGPGGLKPVLARPGVRHIRLPTALHNLQAFNIATPAAANVQPPDSTASPAPVPTPPDLVDTRAMSSPWPDRDAGEVKPERENSSPEGSEPWNLPSSSIADDYGYEEIVRTDNMDRTVLDAIPDRYSPDLEARRIFDKMFDSDSKKSMYDSRCGYDIDASDDDKAYHQVVHRKDGRHTTRLAQVSAAAFRHKYSILEHELSLQKSLSEECEDLGVDSPSASELFPEAELLFAPSPAHDPAADHCHTPQPTLHSQVPPPELDSPAATDHLLPKEPHELDINLDDVGEIVTVGEDGMTTIPLDHEEFARSHEEFARSHPNTTFHSEPEDGEVPPPFTIAQTVKGRQITFHSRGVPATVVMAPQTTVISQATVEASGTQNPVKFSDLSMINVMPTPQHMIPSVLKESNETLTKFDRLLNESREMNVSNAASAIVHSTGNGTQVIRRVQYERRDSRYLVEDDAMIAGNPKTDERRDMDDTSSSERHPELFWDTQSRPERKRFDFSSDSDKCCKSPFDETNSDSSGVGAHTRLDTVIKAARTERRRSDGSSAEESHPPLRTYPPKRAHQHGHHSHHHDGDRSTTGKTRASDRCHDVKDESRRRASNRGVVKRGCHCCNGSTPPKPKKSRPKKTSDYPHS